MLDDQEDASAAASNATLVASADWGIACSQLLGTQQRIARRHAIARNAQTCDDGPQAPRRSRGLCGNSFETRSRSDISGFAMGRPHVISTFAGKPIVSVELPMFIPRAGWETKRLDGTPNPGKHHPPAVRHCLTNIVVFSTGDTAQDACSPSATRRRL
ncbi:hypothetical protein CMUS01_02034 [Colletotrichum musicola]|uniref:Uncharacterized protein n=1 Tax=Colletotrichum musicola TaxID=2175873 RepID=A0A8H6U7H4_9PEZI|nr:hypothetical protein CMUS01_02034 [Colletotrichum musicola]